ncbi:MAG: Alanine--tRNA ligase [Chlamydiae bacterium]|nr:Alanine--tRNA ligase [Chlamydiota bacterium]
MSLMNSQELRRKFLKYFKEKGHTIVPSAPVVPHDDPTLLFNNAGMNQFKDVFLAKAERDYTRATSAQKCIRVGGKHNDLDNVGHTKRHLTFFEMLGNFSFGDYFKEEAISFAWELTLNVFELPEEKLWITIFEEDNEAFEIWKKIVPENRIVRMSAEDNFWSMGDTGPCGPCSELHYDRGPKYGDAPTIKEDLSGERYIEFWNLVFMQYNRDKSGKMQPLPNKSIDTGAGLERIMALKLDVDNVFHTDVLRELVGAVERTSGRKYDPNDPIHAPAYHVIADHIRSLAFAIADGAQPSNIERGYVLRKLLRRAVRYGRALGLQQPFLAELLPPLVQLMGDDYQELKSAEQRISELLTVEEESFLRTMKRGGNILSDIVAKAEKSTRKEITGEEAFKLKDTYGFPLEEILLIAKDSGLQVNIDSYQLLEEKARETSRSSRVVHSQEAGVNLYKEFSEEHDPCAFLGYSETSSASAIIGLIKDGQFVDTLAAGDEGSVILDRTPFYSEKGGQMGDTGQLTDKEGHMVVTDTTSPFPELILHSGTLEEGLFRIGQKVHAHVNEERRGRIAIHHTATHLLHYALQEVLGEHIRQAGSVVEEDRLRFDFNHHKSVSREELRAIENLVNEKIRENTPVNTYEIPFEQAQKQGEIKQFFGEKYAAHVRVVDISYSKELCGGTHAAHVGMLGYFRIAKEGSISAGVRRIEGVCGRAAEELVEAREDRLLAMSQLLKTQPPKALDKLALILDENLEQKQQLRSLRMQQIKQLASSLSNKVEKVGELPLIAMEVPVPPEDLIALGDLLAEKLPSYILVLAAKAADRAQLLVKVSPDLITRGIAAGALVKELAPLIGGGGGGKAESAQAGGKNPNGIDKALEAAKSLLAAL